MHNHTTTNIRYNLKNRGVAVHQMEEHDAHSSHPTTEEEAGAMAGQIITMTLENLPATTVRCPVT